MEEWKDGRMGPSLTWRAGPSQPVVKQSSVSVDAYGQVRAIW